MSRLRRGGRAIFLIVLLLAVAGCLLVEGYSHRDMGRSGTNGGTAGAAGLPATSGPVLDLSGGVVRSARLPDRTVALTFDDGPDPRWTPALLELLERKRVPATFFLVGSRVLDRPDLVARERRDGDALGVHT